MEYLGNCVDSFDMNGDCVNPYLPFIDVNEFACAVEENDNITYKGIMIQYDEEKDIFTNNVGVETRVPYFGSTLGIEYLDRNL